MGKPGEYNILIGNPSTRDIEIIFGPIDKEDEFICRENSIRWPNLLKETGSFKSTSQARKNGWDKDIANGYTEVKVGRKRIYILKNTKEFLEFLQSKEELSFFSANEKEKPK